jgi:hypothetical protein
MPRYNETKKTSEELNAELDQAKKASASLPTAPKEEAKPKEKEVNWAMWYVITAIAVFFLGILTICLINYWIGDGFGL